jgi:hypothetical protein
MWVRIQGDRLGTWSTRRSRSRLDVIESKSCSPVPHPPPRNWNACSGQVLLRQSELSLPAFRETKGLILRSKRSIARPIAVGGARLGPATRPILPIEGGGLVAVRAYIARDELAFGWCSGRKCALGNARRPCRGPSSRVCNEGRMPGTTLASATTNRPSASSALVL